MEKYFRRARWDRIFVVLAALPFTIALFRAWWTVSVQERIWTLNGLDGALWFIVITLIILSACNHRR